MVVILNKNQVFFYKNHIFFVGRQGIVSFNINIIKDTLQIIVEKTYVKVLLSNSVFQSNQIFIYNKINQALSMLNFLYKKKIVIYGIGFRGWLYKRSYLRSSNLILKIGFSRDLCISLPLCIRAVVLKPTLILLKSFNNIELNQFASFLRSLKHSDVYKGKGLKYRDEKVFLKPGKHK